VDGRPVGNWRRDELARAVGVVTQREETVFPLRVGEAVMLGRYARLGPLAAPGPEDRAAVADALRRCNVAGLEARRVDELSGGEWQRVRVARALAQAPRALVLDELTHQLNLASRFADRLLLLHEGRPVALGRPAEVLTQDALTRVFRWPVAIAAWSDGSPQVVPLRPGEAPAPGFSDTGARP
jgi:iron complex transport system ATP-binding protein